jgi:hypothetical protein
MPKNKGDPALFKKTRRSKVGKKRNAQRSIDTLTEQNLARHQYHGKFVTKKGRINALSVPIKYTDAAGVEIIRGRRSNGIVGRRNTQPVFDFLAQAGAGLGVPHPQQANPPPDAAGAPRIPPVAQPILGGNPAFQGGHWRAFGRQPAGRGVRLGPQLGNAAANNNVPLGANNNLAGGFLPAAPLGGGYMGANLVAAANANPPPPPPHFIANAAGYGSIQPANMGVPHAAYNVEGREHGVRPGANVIPASPGGEAPLVNAKGWGHLNVDEQLLLDEQAQLQLAYQNQAPNARPPPIPRYMSPGQMLNTSGINLNLNATLRREKQTRSAASTAVTTADSLLPPGIDQFEVLQGPYIQPYMQPLNTQVQALYGQLANDQVQRTIDANTQANLIADQAKANAVLVRNIPLLPNNDHKRRFDNFQQKDAETKINTNTAIENLGLDLSNRMLADNTPQIDQGNPFLTPDRGVAPTGPIAPQTMMSSTPPSAERLQMMQVEDDLVVFMEKQAQEKLKALEKEIDDIRRRDKANEVLYGEKIDEVEDQRFLQREKGRRKQEASIGRVREASTASEAERAAYAAFFKDHIDDREAYFKNAMARLNSRISAPITDAALADLTEANRQEILASMAKMMKEYKDIVNLADTHKDLKKQALAEIMRNNEPADLLNIRINDIKDNTSLEGGLFIRLNRFRAMVDEYEDIWTARAQETAAIRQQAAMSKMATAKRNETANGQETVKERALEVRSEMKSAQQQLPDGRRMLDLGPHLSIMHDPNKTHQFTTPQKEKTDGQAPPRPRHNPKKVHINFTEPETPSATPSAKEMPGRTSVKGKSQDKAKKQTKLAREDIQKEQRQTKKLRKINTVRVGQIGHKVNVEKVQSVELSDLQARAAARLLAENAAAKKATKK